MEEQAAVSEVKRCGGSFCFKTKGDRDLTDDDLLLKKLKSLWQVIVFKPTDLHLTSTPACQKLFTVYASAFSQLLCVESLKKLYLTYLFIWSYGFFVPSAPNSFGGKEKFDKYCHLHRSAMERQTG